MLDCVFVVDAFVGAWFGGAEEEGVAGWEAEETVVGDAADVGAVCGGERE